MRMDFLMLLLLVEKDLDLDLDLKLDIFRERAMREVRRVAGETCSEG